MNHDHNNRELRLLEQYFFRCPEVLLTFLLFSPKRSIYQPNQIFTILRRVEFRFFDVCRRARFLQSLTVTLGERAKHDNGNPGRCRVLAKSLQHLFASQPGQQNVKNDEIRLTLPNLAQGLFPIAGFCDIETGFGQDSLACHPLLSAVLDQKNLLSHGAPKFRPDDSSCEQAITRFDHERDFECNRE